MTQALTLNMYPKHYKECTLLLNDKREFKDLYKTSCFTGYGKTTVVIDLILFEIQYVEQKLAPRLTFGQEHVHSVFSKSKSGFTLPFISHGHIEKGPQYCGDPGLWGSDPRFNSHQRSGTSLKT